MSDWQSLFLEPREVENSERLVEWFTLIAQRVLNGTILMVGQEKHRFTEIEFYYHGGKHLDVFTHRDPIQTETGRWYFHRTRGVYRGGSFKGVDITFGGPKAFGGILIRGIATAADQLIDGPSLTVDHLLARTEAPTVAELDEAIEGRVVWDPESPLHVVMTDIVDRPLLRSARVGLSLKRLRASEPPPRFIMRPYRYLSEPKRISKGKAHMVLALHAQGHPAEKIREMTGCTKGALERYVADFEEGRKSADFTPFWGIDIGPRDLSQLHGVWHAKFGSEFLPKA
jgi:hypothetical protein